MAACRHHLTRAWVVVLVALVVCGPRGGASQQPALAVLRIKIVLADADQNLKPVQKHAILISDNPATAAPRRTITSVDGTAELRLRPGSYTIESERPVAFLGKAYEWSETVKLTAGRDLVLELNAGNATVAVATTPDTPEANTPAEPDMPALLLQWQDSVVEIWSETARGSGFLIDPKGLVATNEHLVHNSASVQVQLTPSVKIAGRVLAASVAKDIAIVWVDPAAVASIRPVRIGYTLDGKGPAVAGQDVFAIERPPHQPKAITTGTVRGVEAHEIVSDVEIASGNSGGPLFTTDGVVIGIATLDDSTAGGGSSVIRIDDARELVAQAEAKMGTGDAPKGTRLPIEPQRPFAVEALKEAVKGRGGSLSAYKMTADDFDINFITPVLTYGVSHRTAPTDLPVRGRRTRDEEPVPDSRRTLEDFGNWTEYLGEFPPVLVIRATPKLVAGFWNSVGRAAAQTQGVDLGPAGKHVKSGFSRMRVYCGDAEVTPIHPFRIEYRASDRDESSAFEGLYIFDPAALGPHCGTVKMVLFTEKEPENGDTRIVDPKVVQQIWQDFAPYRSGG